MKTEKFQTVTRLVDAVQVTEENMADVSRWCKGKICTTDPKVAEQLGKPVQTWIQVNAQNPINEKQTQARVGDWILYANRGYKVYTNASFKRNFEPVMQKIDVKQVVENTKKPQLKNMIPSYKPGPKVTVTERVIDVTGDVADKLVEVLEDCGVIDRGE
jgi:hypothetical protein